MFSLKKLCFVCSTQRCFKSEEIPTDFTVNLSALPPSKGCGYLSSQAKMSEAPQFKRLQLTIVEGDKKVVGQTFTIDCEGMRNSKRFKSDGRTYAGYDEYENDIVLPKDEFGVGSVHFVIEFNSMANQYMIKDQGDGTGTFVKLTFPHVLQSYHILSFGSTHMTVILSKTARKTRLSIKFIEGPKIGQTFTFDDPQEVIKIGRTPDCTIQFDHTSLSRHQCVITYKPEGWTVQDGDGVKGSTNGTWLFIDDYFPMESGMVFKAGSTLFRVRDMQAAEIAPEDPSPVFTN